MLLPFALAACDGEQGDCPANGKCGLEAEACDQVDSLDADGLPAPYVDAARARLDALAAIEGTWRVTWDCGGEDVPGVVSVGPVTRTRLLIDTDDPASTPATCDGYGLAEVSLAVAAGSSERPASVAKGVLAPEADMLVHVRIGGRVAVSVHAAGEVGGWWDDDRAVCTFAGWAE